MPAKAIDDLNDRIDRLCQLLEAQDDGRSSSITVTHTQAGNMGFYGGVAVACCVSTVVLMIAFMIVENRSYAHLDAQVDQLRAWNDVHSAAIAKLQAQTKREP